MKVIEYKVAADCVVATKELDDNGNATVRDASGRILGYYRACDAVVTNFYGIALAKGDWTINLVKFRKHYVPTPVPFDRFYTDALGKLVYKFYDSDEFAEQMQKVKFEDLQALTQEELDQVPIPYLYDWAKISGCTEFADGVYEYRKERELK